MHKNTAKIILYVELNASINARNNDKIFEYDRFIILGGKFFIKLPQLLRPQQEFVQLIVT